MAKHTSSICKAQRCTYPDHTLRRKKCTHIYSVEYSICRETTPDGTVKVTKTIRVTYCQNWPATMPRALRKTADSRNCWLISPVTSRSPNRRQAHGLLLIATPVEALRLQPHPSAV